MREDTTTPAPAVAATSRLGASFDLAHAAARREELLAHAAMGESVLDLSAITCCDLAGLQLLAAARATATANQVPLRLDQPSPAVLAACAAFGIDLQSTIANP